MALIDKASLLMVPSTYEAGKLYNVLPSGNRAPDNKGGAGYDQTRADFDFDRGSNTAATRIGSDGLIKKYRENVLTESNNFSDWDLASITLTSGQSGYDGSNDAWIASKNAATTYRYISQLISSSGVQTASVYAKAGTLSSVALYCGGGTNPYVYFNLSTGAIIGQRSSVIDSSITDLGDGWYHLTMTFNESITFFQVYPDWNLTNTGTILIQNAQLESGLVATDVLTSGATTGKAGVLVDLPRINYDANGENGALLLEPSRQQLFQYSEYYNTYYTIDGVSVSDNATTSPEGLQNASKLVEDSANSKHRIGKATFPSGTQRTLSVFAKAGERNYISLFENNSVGNDVKGAIFNLSNGTLSINNSPSYYSNPTIEPIGSNGWYRCSVTWTPTSLSVPSFGVSADGLENTYQGNGTSGIYIWGAQFEAGSYATSYIPNHGESGGVTRAADSCSVTGASDVIGQTEGTLFVEAETLENGADCRITISDNTINNRVSIEWDANADTIKGFIGVGGNVESTNHNQTNRNKIAIVYNSSDARFFINGTKVMTDTSVPSLSGMDRIEFANFGAAVNTFFGKVYKMYVSEEKLTDAEAITLTTL